MGGMCIYCWDLDVYVMCFLDKKTVVAGPRDWSAGWTCFYGDPG